MSFEKIGIDKIGFYTPEFYLDLADLAQARQVDPNKFKIGIGQDQQTILPADQDVVTMAANAAAPILTAEERAQIDLVIFASESGIDQSKAGSLYLQRLLGLSQAARAFEIKEACYGATAGLQMAYDHLTAHPDSQKVLVVASDVARYGIETAGEVTQGAGAVAMLVTRAPRILVLNQPSAYFSEEVMDFWRPNYSDTAFAKGKFSTEQYLRFLEIVWREYQTKTQEQLTDFTALLFHIPYTKLGLKGLRQMTADASEDVQQRLLQKFETATIYNRRVGNIYTGSLYLSLLSLLQNAQLADSTKLGLFSYGSGAVGEFFSGEIQSGYQQMAGLTNVADLLDRRQQLTVKEYEQMFAQTLPTDGSTLEIAPVSPLAEFHLTGITAHQRQYR
ncbi:hydroxymethylglutaryl-CoA synthase [Lapidilactobacillus mulanensis]|uniref:Hydroxymethylglutaryl-CoA synthase n=1 Tax=Lapidilactobacillus mulanensis TaxID=2485999 RepID=A0ABW4DSC5_9LACO|nr:hydroxymethylglutaryl-CoA synthase [Lapidilactobacillus mulanensis]